MSWFARLTNVYLLLLLQPVKFVSGIKDATKWLVCNVSPSYEQSHNKNSNLGVFIIWNYSVNLQGAEKSVSRQRIWCNLTGVCRLSAVCSISSERQQMSTWSSQSRLNQLKAGPHQLIAQFHLLCVTFTLLTSWHSASGWKRHKTPPAQMGRRFKNTSDRQCFCQSQPVRRVTHLAFRRLLMSHDKMQYRRQSDAS